MSVVLTEEMHTPSLEGMMPVVKTKDTKTIVVCVGRKQPSKAALDRFVEVYKQIVEENRKKNISHKNCGS